MNKKKTADKPYSSAARTVDRAMGLTQKGFFRLLTGLLYKDKLPMCTGSGHPFYGRDKKLCADVWKGGFSSRSIIPEQWRCTADGTPDPEGFCLNEKHATGGYQTLVSKLFTDQRMNTFVLSALTEDGKEQGLLIYISVDGVGVSAGTCMKIRKAVAGALEKYGVEQNDVFGCNVFATHCHAGLDTLGMSVGELAKRKFAPNEENHRSVNPEIENSLIERAAESVAEAYAGLENGELYFYETGKTGGVGDKLGLGVKVKNTFSCLLFEGQSGKKTVITNIGAHPTSYGAWDKNEMMCADYPCFMGLAMREWGYNLVFTQSAQASVSGPFVDCEKNDTADIKTESLIEKHLPSREQWAARYGTEYTDVWYGQLGQNLRGHMKKGFLLADFVISGIDKSHRVTPRLRVFNAQSLVSFDYGVLELAYVSGLLGGKAVETTEGFGILAETDYIELGDGLAFLTAPAELSPALVFGTDPDYGGHTLWNGERSWSGRSWEYDTIEKTVNELTGRKLIFTGLTNGMLGYVFPDICTPRSLLGTLLFYKNNPGDMSNSMLLTCGTSCGSALVKQYAALVKKASEK